MEIKLENPGEYRFFEGQALPEAILATETLECLLPSVVDLLAVRDINPFHSVIIVKPSGVVTAVVNRNPSPTVFTTQVTGGYDLSKPIRDLQINSAGWAPTSLAKLARHNPHLFAGSEGLALYKALLNLQSTKTKQTANEQDTRGNRDARNQVTTLSNLPHSITCMFPLVTGGEIKPREVLIELSPEDELVYLIYPDLNRELNEWINAQHERILEWAGERKVPVIFQ